MKKKYLTEFKHKGRRYAGKEIFAKSFKKAKKKAKRKGLKLIGEVVAEYNLN